MLSLDSILEKIIIVENTQSQPVSMRYSMEKSLRSQILQYLTNVMNVRANFIFLVFFLFNLIC